MKSEGIMSLKEEQRTMLKVFLDRKYVFFRYTPISLSFGESFVEHCGTHSGST